VSVGRHIVRTGLTRFLNACQADLPEQPDRGRQPVFSSHGGGASGQAGLPARGDAWACARPVGLSGTYPAPGARASARPSPLQSSVGCSPLINSRPAALLSDSRPTPLGRRHSIRVSRTKSSLHHEAIVRCVAENTSWQPRPRLHPTRPAKAGFPRRVEPEDRRAGAPHRVAAVDTRPGQGSGLCPARKRQQECVTFMAHLAAAMPATIPTRQLVCEDARAHHGPAGRRWGDVPPQFVVHVTPAHSAWPSPVAPWGSILQRTQLRSADVAPTADLEAKRMPFMAAGHAGAHPVHGTPKSAATVRAARTPTATAIATPSCLTLY
jgi:hypothetical protein